MKKTKECLIIFCIILIMVLLETILYELARFISYEPFILSSSLDDKIPFIPLFIYPYILWYLVIIVCPFLIYLKNKQNFYKYITALFFTIIIGFVIFISFPTTVDRPQFEVTNITTWCVNAIYNLDTPSLCCLPSMHCALCFLILIYTLTTKDFSFIEKILISIVLLSIVCSTVFIKQHVLIDIVLALIITVAVSFVTNNYLKDTFNNILMKLKIIK